MDSENESKLGPKRTPRQHERDMAFETELYLKGYSYYDIAQAINQRYSDEGIDLSIGIASIAHDITNVIYPRWLNNATLNFTQVKAKELAKLDRLEIAYWEAYERSILDAIVIEDEQGNDVVVMQGGKAVPVTRTKKKETKKGRDGSIEFLDGIKGVIEMRCKIWGLFSPQKLMVDWRTEAVQGGFAKDESEANKQFEKLVSTIHEMRKDSEQEKKE